MDLKLYLEDLKKVYKDLNELKYSACSLDGVIYYWKNVKHNFPLPGPIGGAGEQGSAEPGQVIEFDYAKMIRQIDDAIQSIHKTLSNASELIRSQGLSLKNIE